MVKRGKRIVSKILCATVLFTMTAVPGAVFAEENEAVEASGTDSTTSVEKEAPAAANDTAQAEQKEAAPAVQKEEAKAPAQESQAAPKVQAAKSQVKAVDTQAARARSVVISGETTSKCNQAITLTARPSGFAFSDNALTYRWYYKDPTDNKEHELTSVGNRLGVKSWTATKSGIYYVKVEGLYDSNTITLTITGHANVAAVPAVEPTCTTAGNKAHYKCNDCGKLFSDQAATQEVSSEDVKLNPLGHKLSGNGTQRKEATCTEDGYESYWTCSVCKNKFADPAGKTEITEPVVIPAAHKLETVAKKDANCTDDGYKAHWKCSACGKLFADNQAVTPIETPEVISATGHNVVWHYAGNNAEKCAMYCTICKTFLSAPIDHDITYKKTDDTTHMKYCERCNSNLKSEEHTWEADYTVDQEPTCTTAGSKSKHCEKCDAQTEITEIPAAHTWAEDLTVDKEPTCTAEGIQSRHCQNCDATKDEQTIAKLPHSMTKTEAKAATCTESGNNEYYTCKTCEQVFKDEAGTTPTTVEAEVIEATGHDLTLVEKVDATCLKDGYEAYWECDVCGDMFTSKEASQELDAPIVIKATGHKLGDWKVVKDPTLEEAGMKERTCEKCDYAETEAIPALDAAKADLTSKAELNKTKETAEAKSDDSAKTSDDMNVALYSLLALLAASGAAGIAYRRRTTGK